MAALLVHENTVHWAVAVHTGGYNIYTGFKAAFKYFSIKGYLFMFIFRLVSYILLGIILIFLSRTKFKHFYMPVFIGGLIGILSIIIWGLWNVQDCFYTDVRCSSTGVIGFLITYIYAVPAGVFGAIILTVLYTPFRFLEKKN